MQFCCTILASRLCYLMSFRREFLRRAWSEGLTRLMGRLGFGPWGLAAVDECEHVHTHAWKADAQHRHGIHVHAYHRIPHAPQNSHTPAYTVVCHKWHFDMLLIPGYLAATCSTLDSRQGGNNWDTVRSKEHSWHAKAKASKCTHQIESLKSPVFQTGAERYSNPKGPGTVSCPVFQICFCSLPASVCLLSVPVGPCGLSRSQGMLRDAPDVLLSALLRWQELWHTWLRQTHVVMLATMGDCHITAWKLFCLFRAVPKASAHLWIHMIICSVYLVSTFHIVFAVSPFALST